MSYKIISVELFEKQTKRLTKKYPSLKTELLALINILKATPCYGTPIGKDWYKIRLSIASKGKGKSGGARIITHFAIVNTTVFLLSIFDKSEKESLTDRELKELLSYISD